MPEWAETRLMTEFADHIFTGDHVIAIHKNPKSKQAPPNIGLPADAAAFHFGKETIISFINLGLDHPIDHTDMRIQYGMSGHWELHRTRFGNKHSLLSFELESGKFLEFVDPRRFGRWTVGTPTLGPSSPCPEIFSRKYVDYLIARWQEPKYQKKRLCEILLDQTVFHGIGNYLRAEILDQLNVDPFQTFGTLSRIQVLRLIVGMRRVMWASYQIGGGKLFTWKNPLQQNQPDAKTWLQCYQKKAWCTDGTKRRFWYDPKWPCPFELHGRK